MNRFDSAVRSTTLTAVVCHLAVFGSVNRAFSADPRTEVVVRDFSQCLPATGLSKTRKRGHWQLISYETDARTGTMLGAQSLIDAPTVTLPLKLQGWYRISLGLWNPVFAYDGKETVVKVKLSKDPCPVIIASVHPGSATSTQFQEYAFKAADLTGQDLVIRQRPGQKAYLAYVRFRPLTAEQVAAVKARRTRPENRVIVASHDGGGYLNRGGGIAVQSREDLWAQVERYRWSDVKRVTWAVNYSHTTNWPSRLGTVFSREFPPGSRGEQTLFAALNGLLDQGINPLHEVCEHAHRVGIQFDAQFRMALLGRTPPDHQAGFVHDHPQFRMITRDGTAVEKASYAFPETRGFLLSMLRETATRIDVDGITLNFIRGGEYVAYEQPVADAFRAAHKMQPQDVQRNDPRLQQVRAKFMTQLVQDARKTLDEIGRKKNKRLKLSVVIYPSLEINMGHALDVKSWAEAGLIDSIYGGERGAIARLAEATGIDFYPGIGPRNTESYLGAWNRWHKRDVGYFVWDMDYNVELPHEWAVLSRMGHDEEMQVISDNKSRPSGILSSEPVVRVGGADVTKLANQEAGYPQKFLFLFSGG